MSNFAQIDSNNIVIQVVVGDNSMPGEGYDWLIDNLGGTWIQTSYNSNIRGTYAGIGFTYNKDQDIFVTPKPYPSWIRAGSFWNAPIAEPSDGKMYQWNEDNQSWDLLSD